MSTLGRTLLAILVALTSLSAISKQVREQGVTDTEIRIGNIMPYSGNLAVFGAIGKAEAAYFEMINERGGINGREIRFISYDDKSNPMAALELTRTLIEKDNVLLMFGSFGTPGNFAVRKYLNERQIPQLFVVSGDDHLFDPSLFPWTMGWQPSFREEGRIYANYTQASYPGRTIAALWQNDQVGREVIKGLEDGLGEVARMIRVDIAYDVADEHLDTHARWFQWNAGGNGHETRPRGIPSRDFAIWRKRSVRLGACSMAIVEFRDRRGGRQKESKKEGRQAGRRFQRHCHD